MYARTPFTVLKPTNADIWIEFMSQWINSKTHIEGLATTTTTTKQMHSLIWFNWRFKFLQNFFYILNIPKGNSFVLQEVKFVFCCNAQLEMERFTCYLLNCAQKCTEKKTILFCSVFFLFFTLPPFCLCTATSQLKRSFISFLTTKKKRIPNIVQKKRKHFMTLFEFKSCWWNHFNRHRQRISLKKYVVVWKRIDIDQMFFAIAKKKK